MHQDCELIEHLLSSLAMTSLEQVHLVFDTSMRGPNWCISSRRPIDADRVPALRSVVVVFEVCTERLPEEKARKWTRVDDMSFVRFARQHCVLSYSRKMREPRNSAMDESPMRKRTCNLRCSLVKGAQTNQQRLRRYCSALSICMISLVPSLPQTAHRALDLLPKHMLLSSRNKPSSLMQLSPRQSCVTRAPRKFRLSGTATPKHYLRCTRRRGDHEVAVAPPLRRTVCSRWSRRFELEEERENTRHQSHVGAWPKLPRGPGLDAVLSCSGPFASCPCLSLAVVSV
jgi:hypothetical protein